MKKLVIASIAAAAFVAGPALAADMRVKAPVKALPVVAQYSWTGCYIGANAGGGWGHKRWSDPALANIVFSEHDVSGGLVGGQIGCDYQTGMWVFGVEASADWARLRGNSIDRLSAGTLNDISEVNFIGTVTGRLGVTFSNALLYVKGGAAVVNDKYVTPIVPSGVLFYEAENSRWGWLVGAGLEYGFAPNWSAKVEYNYMDFGTNRLNFVGGVFRGTAPFDINQTVQVAKVGINYRFGGSSPLVARY